MINPKAIMALKPTARQAAALALYASLYSKNPAAVKKLLEKHEQNFTWDPNIDLMQIAQLSKSRGNFFNQDFNKTFDDARYFSFSDALDKIKDVVSNVASVVIPAAASVAPGLINSLTGGGGGGGGSSPEGGTSEGMDPGVTSALLTGGASALGGILGNLFKKPTAPASPTAPPQSSSMPQLPAPLQQAVQQTFSQAPSDSDSSGSKILDAIKNMITPPPPATTDKILGMPKKTFYIVAASVAAVIIAVVVFLIVRSNKKPTPKDKK